MKCTDTWVRVCESAYEQCLCHELSLRDLHFERQVALPVTYKSIKLDCGYRADIIVDEKLVLEIKAVDSITPLHQAQILTYLKMMDMRVGLILNFNVPVLKDGIKRMVNRLKEN
ncbi:MAG: GxxExxY protein [Planctomycetota bacterium]